MIGEMDGDGWLMFRLQGLVEMITEYDPVSVLWFKGNSVRQCWQKFQLLFLVERL